MEQIRIFKWQTFIYAILLAAFLTFLTMNQILSKITDGGTSHNLSMSILLFGFSLFILVLNDYYFPKSTIVRLSVLFLMLTLPTLIYSSLRYTDFLYGFLTFAFIPLALSLGRYFGKIFYILDKPDILTFILILPPIIGYFILISSQNITQLNLGSRDFSFAIIAFLPLILYFKSPILRYSMLIFMGYISIISAKRSIIIVFVLFLIFILTSNSKNFKNITSKRLIIGFIVLTGVVFATMKIFNENQKDFQIVEKRFSQIQDDGGSGRIKIYNKLLDEIELSDVVNLSFGHGFNAVEKEVFGHPAHNDFLEILYNFGLIPLIVYLLFFLKILSENIKLFLRRKQLGGIYVYTAGSLINILTLGLLNCIITNSLLVFINMFILGISIEYTENMKDKYG